MNEYSFVVSMVAKAFEEYPTRQRRDLQSFNVDIDAEFVPCQKANEVGDEGSKESVEVEEKEENTTWT